MKRGILILDSYDGFRQAALQACMELQYEPTIIPAYNADLDLVGRIKELFPNDPDVMITRGALAPFLAKYFPNSIISLANPDDIDFLAALKKALRYGDRIGLIVRDEYEFEKKESIYKNILGDFFLKSYRYEKAEEITNVLLKAKSDRMDATVGGGTLAFAAAAKVGIRNIFVPTSVLSIKKALQTSLLHMRYKDEERRKNQYSSIVTNHIEYGVLIITDNIIRFANKAMGDVLKVNPAFLIGKSMEDVFDKESRCILDLQDQDEELLPIRGQKFLTKREDSFELENTKTFLFQSAKSLQKKEQTIRDFLTDRGYSTRYSFSNLVAESKNMREVVRMARIYARTSAPVLITGDSGTGKEVISQSIHHASSRAKYPFVAVNCASIPGELFESELYGYEEGAFTGAKRGGKQGLFEIAHGGTLLLDEINSLPLDLQGKLLRTIEENEFRRVGSEKVIRSDVRLICATNESLTDLIDRREFRRDLYYRISTFLLNIDDLNARKEDILPIAKQLLHRYCEKYGISISDFTPEEERILTQHYYAGNVRELENIIHRFVIQSVCMERCDLLRICIGTQTDMPCRSEEDGYITIKRGTLDRMESEIIDTFLKESNNKCATAEQLGISRSTLYRKLQEEA